MSLHLHFHKIFSSGSNLLILSSAETDLGFVKLEVYTVYAETTVVDKNYKYKSIKNMKKIKMHYTLQKVDKYTKLHKISKLT